MKRSFFVLLAGSLVSVSGFAKISIFSNSQVAVHVLQSKELLAKQAQGERLAGLELTSLGIQNSGPEGIGATYDVSLKFANLRGLLTVCSLTATVVNEKAPAPPGITASQLSAPQLSEIDCAEK